MASPPSHTTASAPHIPSENTYNSSAPPSRSAQNSPPPASANLGPFTRGGDDLLGHVVTTGPPYESGNVAGNPQEPGGGAKDSSNPPPLPGSGSSSDPYIVNPALSTLEQSGGGAVGRSDAGVVEDVRGMRERGEV